MQTLELKYTVPRPSAVRRLGKQGDNQTGIQSAQPFHAPKHGRWLDSKSVILAYPTRLFLASLLLCAIQIIPPTGLHADEPIDEVRAANLEKTAAWFADQQAAATTNAHWKLLPRIVIDTKEPSVLFKAEATGLAANEIVEFYLIGERSGNAYEAVAVALAQPKDIAKAIEKMGLPRGLHVDQRAMRFWPQGERVHLFLNDHHAADLILDKRTSSTAKREGFVFTASRHVKRDGEKQLAAHVEAPFSIASNYNEPNTILDVPFQAPQSEVYTQQVQNPDIRFDPGELLTVKIVPERPDGSRRVQEMDLTLTATEDPTHTVPIANVRFTLQQVVDDDTKTHMEASSLQNFVNHIREQVSKQQDPFVSVRVAPHVSLAQAHSAATILHTMEQEEGLRVLQPPEGELFYRAFMPDESRRNRADRIAQPWELHLSHEDPPMLIHIEEEWLQGEARPQIQTQDIPIQNPESLADKMESMRPGINAVFFYAPADMRVGTIMEIVQHIQETHPLIHVFMDSSPRDQTSDAIPEATSE